MPCIRAAVAGLESALFLCCPHFYSTVLRSTNGNSDDDFVQNDFGIIRDDDLVKK